MNQKSLALIFIIFLSKILCYGQSDPLPGGEEPEFPRDTTIIFDTPHPLIDTTRVTEDYKNAAGLKIALSSYGFALGGFYQKKISKSLRWNSFTYISEAKETTELPTGIDETTFRRFIPNKINRLMFMPFMTGIRSYMLQDRIVDTFKPYIGAGGGAAIIMSAPYREGRELFREDGTATPLVGFFESLGQADFYFKHGGYVELGAEFNNGLGAYSSLNLRYFYIPFGDEGIESVVGAPVEIFGKFFISLDIGKRF